MVSEQVPYIDRLKTFAHQNGFETQMTTYGNKPHYDKKEAPVLKIITHSNLKEAAELGQRIQQEVFNNNLETQYSVVP